MLESPLIGRFTANRAGAKHRGRYVGVLNIAFAAAAILAPVVGMQIHERFGPTAMWVGTGGLGILAGLTTLWMSRRGG
jgi:MFS family permease